MSYDTTRGELETIFSEIGEIVEIFVPTDRITGRPRGFAFVEFTEQNSAEQAIERYDGYELSDRWEEALVMKRRIEDLWTALTGPANEST